MRLETAIKYDLLLRRHSLSYADERKGNEVLYFAVVSSSNRFSNELFGLKQKANIVRYSG